MMCRDNPPPQQRGSILLLTLLTTSVLAMLALSFAATMKSSIQVTRDHNAHLLSDLAAQSGLEFAQHHLLQDPEWDGTSEEGASFGEDITFVVTRAEGPKSRVLPTEVTLTIQGIRSKSLTQLQAKILVTPGDPLLDKSVSILGGASGSNLVINGDYLLIDAAGHLWEFREDLIAGVKEDERIVFDADMGDRMVMNFTSTQIARIKEKIMATVDGELSKTSTTLTEEERKIAYYAEALDLWAAKGGGEAHISGEENQVLGVWLPVTDESAPVLSLSRVDAPGDLHHYANTNYDWAESQELEEDPVHAPGWKLNSYLNADPDLLLVENMTDVRDVTTEKTMVFYLDPDDHLYLENVHFGGGMVVFTEADYDSAGPPRNTLTLGGACVIGGGTGGKSNIGILAPGCRLSTSGAQRQTVTGFSVLHSLDSVQRLVHHGVLIILNSAVGILDSSFTYDRNVAVDPPFGLSFFGDLPLVDIVALEEDYSPEAKL
jgi:hypothetical protein